MAIILLLTGMFIIAVMRVYLPLGTKAEGKQVRVLQLSFRERVLVQRTNLYLLAAVILIGAVGGFLRGPLQMVAIVGTFALLMIPVRYTLTTKGIAVNNVVFRGWSDFTGFREERTSIVLEAVEGQRSFRIHVLGGNRDDLKRALVRLEKPARASRTRGSARTNVKVQP